MSVRPRGILPFLALLALAALALALVLRPWRTPGEEAAPAPARTEGPVVPPSGREVAPPRETNAAGVTPDTAAQRRAVAATEPADTPGSTRVLVRVVDGVTGSPVPKARVLALDPEAFSAWRSRLSDPRTANAVDAALEAGRPLRADREGELLVEVAAPWSQLICEDAGRFGALRLDAEDVEAAKPQRLVLARENVLEIEVTGEDGVPRADVPVALVALWGPISRPVWSGRTAAPGGLARVPHPREVAARAKEAGFGAELALPLEPPVRTLLAPSDLPERVRLVLPPTGALEVRLLAEDGAPPAAAHVWLTPLLAPDPLSNIRFHPRPFLAVVSEGIARFDLVGLGLEFELEAESEDGAYAATARVEGPRGEGETVRVDLRLEPAGTRVVALLLDPDGRPYADRPVTLETWWTVRGRPYPADEREGTTDEGGRVSIRLPAEELDPIRRREDARVWFAFRARDLGQEPPGVLHVRSPELEPPAADARCDLGVLRLVSEPLLAAGRVVDDLGEPASGARVVARERVADPERGESWQRSDALVSVDATGRFTVHGRAGGLLGLTAFAPGLLARYSPLPVPAGTRDVEIVLTRAATLAGTLRVGAGVDPSQLHLSVRTEGDPRGPLSFAPGEDGAFRYEDLEPGRATLELRIDELDEEPLRRLDGLSLEPGRTTTLEPIDLTDSLHAITLELVDEQGHTLEGGAIAYRAASSTAREWAAKGAPAGRATLLVGVATLEVHATARDRRTMRFENVTGDARLVLPEAPRVRVHLPADVPLPDLPQVAAVALEPVDPLEVPIARGSLRGFDPELLELLSPRPVRALFDETRTATLRVPQSGRQRVRFEVILSTAERRGRTGVAAAPGSLTIDVPDAPGVLDVELRPQPEAWAHALDD